ncbi:MAG: SAM-dependent chlorinase/fluorinase [Candidatus Dormibacteraeota bacterium]|nr:SAM-dependent chlorinase/fluorinase [Candidatus Dormibacteraeota bacterium]
MAVVTLTTDFGSGSPYVAAMKARLLAACPGATLVDVAHDLPSFDIGAAAFVLWAGTRDFGGPGHVHLAVVDPGVGTGRRAVAVEVRSGAFYVAPDNGLLEFALRHLDPSRVVSLAVPAEAAPTFHGRDVFAPAAGWLAAGADLSLLGAPAEGLVRLPDSGAVVLWVDTFGNVVTGLQVMPAGVRIGGRLVTRRAATYGAAPVSEPFLYLGSLGYVEIGVRQGRADEELGLRIGSAIQILT